ncbi:MAG: hypothetical protein GY804_10305 [Alphaproteobacteria bacterium]|nr:hypothetical protein [Alphaproteobacteria bacterium]
MNKTTIHSTDLIRIIAYSIVFLVAVDFILTTTCYLSVIKYNFSKWQIPIYLIIEAIFIISFLYLFQIKKENISDKLHIEYSAAALLIAIVGIYTSNLMTDIKFISDYSICIDNGKTWDYSNNICKHPAKKSKPHKKHIRQKYSPPISSRNNKNIYI